MNKKSEAVIFSLPPDIGKLVLHLAKAEHRTVSELIHEALRQYSSMKILMELHKKAKKRAKNKGLTAKDVEKIIDEGREYRGLKR